MQEVKEVKMRDVTAYLPLKIYMDDKVYNLNIIYSEENDIMEIMYTSRLDNNSDVFKSINYTFDKSYIEISLIEILNDLLDGGAVVVNDNLQPVGNEQIVNNVDKLVECYRRSKQERGV